MNKYKTIKKKLSNFLSELKVYWRDFLWVLFPYEDDDEKNEKRPSKKIT